MYWSPIRIFQLWMLGILIHAWPRACQILGHLQIKVSFQTHNSSQLMLIVMNCWWVYPEPEKNGSNKFQFPPAKWIISSS